MELVFGVPDWPHGLRIPADEIVSRLRRRFPIMLTDREKGNALVQKRLDELIAMRVPEVILESHKWTFDNTIYVSITEPGWQGATATSYVQSIQNPALEGVHFELTDVADAAAQARIIRDLGGALDMALCSEINWETGGLLPGRHPPS